MPVRAKIVASAPKPMNKKTMMSRRASKNTYCTAARTIPEKTPPSDTTRSKHMKARTATVTLSKKAFKNTYCSAMTMRPSSATTNKRK